MKSPLPVVATAAITAALVAATLALAAPSRAARADDPAEAAPPATRPINGNDAAGLPVLRADNPTVLADYVGDRVVIVGTVRQAQWSRSGKVMNVTFVGAEPAAFGAAVFEKNRKAFDDAFGGDFAAMLENASVRLTGVISEYGGRSERHKGRPELVLTDPGQVTITERAEPTTRP